MGFRASYTDVTHDGHAAPAGGSDLHQGRADWEVVERRVCLAGMALLRVLVVAAIVTWVLEAGPEPLLPLAWWFVGGGVAGWLLAALQRHPRRVLGLVPAGGLGLTAALAWGAWAGPDAAGALGLGFFAALTQAPLAAAHRRGLPDGARAWGIVGQLVSGVGGIATGAGLAWLLREQLTASQQLWLLAAAAGLSTLAALWYFRRSTAEQLLEVAFFAMYRFRGAGPGLHKVPLHGPVLLVANHSAWFDPLWLGKYVPRRIIPMMTSVFFDMPLMRWAMVHLAQAIRVEQRFRREVPELKQAIAALDRGDCVLIFPEGGMRRKEEQPLHMFGQGVWHILKERPETPVVVCWIEGGWGSYFSYFNGPPTKNKPRDWRRPIGIAMGEPHVIDAEVLKDQRKTRLYLMARCGELRQHLGLEPYRPPQVEEGAEASHQPDA